MDNLQVTKLGDHISVLTDYHANGSYKTLKANVELLDEPNYAVMIRTTNFEQDEFTQKLKYITKHSYDFLKKSKVYPNDILMNKIANAGSVYLMPDLNRPVSLAMNLFLIRTKPETTNQVFIYYYLKANERYVKSFATGTASPTINKKAVRNLEIKLPSLNIQSKIANILLTIDKLIDKNSNRIGALENLARTIFHVWFGEINYRSMPHEWKKSKLTDFVSFERGTEPGSKNYQDEPGEKTVQFIRVGDLKKHTSNIWIDNELTKGKMLTRKDIAISLDGTVGIVRIGLEGCYSTGIRKIVHKNVSDKLGWSYTYLLLQSKQIQDTILAHAKGTTILHASSSIKHLTFSLPTKDIMLEFEEKVAPLLKLILKLQLVNINLRSTRDLLLPRLVSGELDVGDLDFSLLNNG